MSVLTGRPGHRHTRLSARYIDDDLVLSATHAWTYLRLPGVPYEFLTTADREGVATRIALAFAGLVTTPTPVDCHLIVTSREVNVDYWADLLGERVAQTGPAPGWEAYRDRMTAHLKDAGFHRREVYLGVCLGPRQHTVDGGSLRALLTPVTRLLTRAETALDYEDDVVSAAELAMLRRKARDVQRSLGQSYLRATPAHPNAVAWLVTKPLWPEMVCPPPTASPRRVWGPGEIEALAEGVVDNGHRYLRVEQVGVDGTVQVGYTARLALSRFPDVLAFPDQEPWMYFAAALPFPVDISYRFTVVPAVKVQHDVKQKLLEAKDQSLHIAETGAMVPLEVQEQLQTAATLEYLIARDRQPWAYGRPRLAVTAADEPTLLARVRTVQEHYRDLAIDVVWPTGDQFDLLCESMPADRVRLRAYEQKQEIALVAGGMPTASSEVGDRVDGAGWVGPYIGETTSRVRSVVHYAPHVAMARNHPPGVAITGSPGAGKSYLAFTLAYQMALSGVWTIYIDPKADAVPMASLPGLGQPRLFDLRHGNDGMLDPFALATSPAEAKLLVMEVVGLLLGQARISEDRENALHRALEHLSAEPSPSLGKLIGLLRAAPADKPADNLGTVLATYAELPFARLCFAPNGGDRVRPDDGLTIVTLLGLDLPTAGTDPDHYGPENRLAVAVMYLLTRYARHLMLNLDKNHPKAICVDEAWVITSTPQGRKLIPEVARMGRSHNTAVVLVSQNAGDLMDEQVTNSLATKFAFRSTNPTEVDNVLTVLGMDLDEEHRLAVRDLRNGECLMQDVDGRIARVQISDWDQTAFAAFNTNPETRGRPVTGPAAAVTG